MVFNENFDCHYFLTFNDWFNKKQDHKMLQSFLMSIKESYLYCSVPHFHNCPDVVIDIAKPHPYFVDKYLTKDCNPNERNEIGLRISPTGFWYGNGLQWAMVSDLTNNIIIIGLKKTVVTDFKKIFSGKYFGIKKVIADMEDFQLSIERNVNADAIKQEMDNKAIIIERYK